MVRVLPLLCVCSEWLLSQPQYLSHAMPSASADSFEVELINKENRSRSTVKSSLASLRPQIDVLVAQKKVEPVDRQRVLIEQIELRGFPPLANGNYVNIVLYTCPEMLRF